MTAASLSNLARPTHVSSPTISTIVADMLFNGRADLIHYAGASYRDEVAWHICLAYLAQRSAAESELKACALRRWHGSV